MGADAMISIRKRKFSMVTPLEVRGMAVPLCSIREEDDQI